MSSNSRGANTAIHLLLLVVIVGLTYVLYRSLTVPYEKVRLQEEVTQNTRDRMGYVRTALIRYEQQKGRFTSSLDSLVMFVKADSLFMAKSDSIFGEGFVADSLPFSPRTGKRFQLSVNDTTRIKTYLLKDPDTDDQIGTALPDITLLNASSWE